MLFVQVSTETFALKEDDGLSPLQNDIQRFA